MHSENGVLIDVGEIGDLVKNADVFGIAFANFPERLIIDTRSDAKAIQLVAVVQPTSGPQERLKWLKRQRPTLGDPEHFSFLFWPHSPSFLVDSGIWDRIQTRVGASIEPDVMTQCNVALRKLENLDHAAMVALLRGENCVTIWPPEQDEDEG